MLTKHIGLVIASLLLIATVSCRTTNEAPPTNAATAKPTATPEPPQNGELASYKFQVAARDGKCVFTYDGPSKGELVSDLSPPCNFSREHNGGVQHIVQKYSGKGGGNYTVMLLIGGPVDPSRTDKYMQTGCGTETQPLSLSPRGVALGGAEGDLTVCPSWDLDRPMFGFSAKPF
jgi:hypothetical protein